LEAGDTALHLANLLGLLLAGLGGRAAPDLVVVRRLAHRIADTLTGPLPLGACAGHQIGFLVGELVVLFAAVTAGDLTLLQKAVVSAAEDGGGVLGQIQFQNPRHTAGEELAVMTHQHDATAKIADEVLQSLQSVEVEIVGRLIKENDVEARQHQCRQSDPRRLSARQCGRCRRCRAHRAAVQTQIRQHRGNSVVEVSCAGGEPMLQCHGVGVGRIRVCWTLGWVR